MPTASGQPLSNLAMEATATRLVERLRAAGHEALFAGGCVRDRLLGKQAHDIDIATSARPEAIQKLFPRTVAVGAQFGVIVVLEDGGEFQVATFPRRTSKHASSDASAIRGRVSPRTNCDLSAA